MISTTDSDEATFSPFEPGADDPVELVWPTSLRRPPLPPYIVYLDLNHWVGLADAAAERPKGDVYQAALVACREAKAAGFVTFPLSATHYMEISKIVSVDRRSNLAVVIEELSGFETLLARTSVMRAEMGAVVDRELISASVPSIDLLGWGVGHALGHAGDLQIVDGNHVDVTEPARRKFGRAKIDALLADAQLALERAILRGPRNGQEEADLRARGWIPDVAVKVAQSRADREVELQGILNADTRWRRGRLRDVVLARELEHEMWDAFVETLAARGVTDLAMMHRRTGARAFQRSMPSVEVTTEMKTAKHRNSSTRWDTNTIFDIDAMGLAVPYCDVVMTERDACSILRKAEFAERMNTVLLSRPDELTTWLSNHLERARVPDGPDRPTSFQEGRTNSEPGEA